MILLRRFFITVAVAALIICAGWFSTIWPAHDSAADSETPEIVAALRNNARLCMENPLEKLVIQRLVVRSFQRNDDPMIELQQLHHPADGAFPSAGAPLSGLAPGRGVVAAYTLFRIPVATVLVEMDVEGMVSCQRL